MVAGEFSNMARTGRPPLGDDKKIRLTLYLTSDQYLSALAAGQGSVSDGVRHQLDELRAYRAWHAEQIAQATQPAVLPRSRHQ